jgi:predicted regulator of amino acid metabolism with ACT domain
MSFMTQISEQVKRFLENDFIIRKCLFRNIISLRALSRHIIKKLELKESNLDAVISAIRRYKSLEKVVSDGKSIKLFSQVAIKTKSNIVDIRVQKSKRSVENISKLNSIIDIEKGEIIRIIQAEQSITIIIDDKNLTRFNDIFGKKDVISLDKNLVEVNLQFTEEAQNIKGILALVTSSLNAEGVNVIEIMSSAPELLIIVKKEDLLKMLNVVDGLQELV